jgi:serine/threonine-protein kinase PknG
MMSTCTQPGCTGTIEDGYCNVCGTPDLAAVPANVRPVTTSGAAPDDGGEATSRGSVRSGSSSQRLASSPLGSLRVAPGSRVTRKLGTGSTRMRGSRLGAGITVIPPQPVGDPTAAMMVVPEVPEDRRVCPACGAPVGRSREGRPGRTEGFCPRCRNPFSFTPKLHKGDLVAGQYEVAGCLAHGGLGWIYLAQDRNVSDRWVVLKGLLNSGDPDAYAAAVKERTFLAGVKHPLIVEIFNFVMHEDAGYIVMEYVGGTSLKSILKERRRATGAADPIPVDQAVAYMIEILPAFQYLHDKQLLYCDFKPDNIIQSGDAVKLIDLGGMLEMGDTSSAIYGTVGYQAPEVPQVGPSIASDLYTIGRTLMVLAVDFRGYQSRYIASLPPADETPLFRRYDSLYRLVAKACARDPNDRFSSADEMRVQMLGVLREIVAADRPEQRLGAHSTSSVLFEAPVVAEDTLTWQDLPALKVDPADPMAAWLAGVSVSDPAARVEVLGGADPQTVEVRLARAQAAVEAGLTDVAQRTIGEILDDDPWEWRAVWVSGLAALRAGDPTSARAAFNAVYGQVPGELAPKLALGLACETSGEYEVAEALYQVCVRTDANYTAPAAFGMARIRSARDDLDGALAALDLVPPTSRAFVDARRQRAALLTGSDRGLPALAAAIDSVQGVTIDPKERAQLVVDVLSAALDGVDADGPQPNLRIAGYPAEERSLRDGLEAAYRGLAGLTEDPHERISLVDQANLVRRWTLR